MHHFETLLHHAASAVQCAANAIRDWENGGDTEPVSDTAWDADKATLRALHAAATIEPALALSSYPETRLGRLVMAARLLVLAGTDEDGCRIDLDTAATVLRAAQPK